MDNIFVTFVSAATLLVVGALVGMGIEFDSVLKRCENGWTHKTVDYVYTCKVEKRP